ncbi:MAG TPA: type IV pilus modification protein PilV, partial [Mycobacterium sp.]|nr:type IV pilus modification protein PilV [Mycobacterium sp.]
MNSRFPTHSCRRQQAGVGLMEVLITVLVLSIGLLGLAGLQATGLRNNHGSLLRTQATMLAADMADRIRANPAGLANYNGIDSTANQSA